METLTILHTNDIHSHLDHWPPIARFLIARRAAEEAAGHSVLAFDDGDAMDREHPLTEATDGQANIALMNTVGYDAVTIGNNEGLGNSHDGLEHLYTDANFPVVLGNLFEPDGTRPAWAQSVVYHTTEAGTRVAVLGFTAPFFLTYTPNGWRVKPVAECLPHLLADIAGTYDVLVLLSHLGLPTDRYLAAHYPELDVIIGGHTHHLLPHGEQVNQTLLAAAGKHGQYVGEITLTLDATHHITNRQATTLAVADLPRQPEDVVQVGAWQEAGVAQLAALPVANLPHGFAIDYDQDSPLLQLGLDAVTDAGGTSAGFLSAGLFLGDLPKGVVTKADLHRLLPHAMHVMTTTLRGTDLWRLVMKMMKNRHFLQRFHLVGMSFRGDIFGWLALRGLTVTAKREVLYNGQPLIPDRQYTITGLDHYLFIPFFPTLEIVGENQLLFPRFLRTVVGDYLQKRFPLD